MHESRLELTSDFANLGRAREFVQEFCRDAPASIIDEDGLAELILAVDEALTNIIKHAYHGDTSQRILIEAKLYPDHLAITLNHWGKTFEPGMIPPPSFDGTRDHGFGLFIIDNCVDDVHYIFGDEKKNAIVLKKNTRDN